MSLVRKRGNRDPERIRHEMEDIFHSMFIHARSVQRRLPNGIALTWRPPIEVYETEDALWVLAEIAGLSQDQIELAIDDRILTIRGERPQLCDESHRSIHEMGILYGSFAADVYLPFAVDLERIEASYENGLLRVRLERVQPTRVAINLQQQGQ